MNENIFEDDVYDISDDKKCKSGCDDSERAIDQGKFGACALVGILNLIIESKCLMKYLEKVNKDAYYALLSININEKPDVDLRESSSLARDDGRIIEEVCPKLPMSVWRMYDKLFSEKDRDPLTKTPFLKSISASEIFDNDRGLHLESMVRAIFLDKINVVNARQSNILIPRMISDDKEIDIDTGFLSSNVYDKSYPLIVIEMQRSVKNFYGTKMESLAVQNIYDIYDINDFSVLQVSGQFRQYVKNSRERARKIATNFYPADVKLQTTDQFLIDLFHIYAKMRHAVYSRICDKTQAVDICSHGKCKLDLEARVHYLQTKIEDKEEKRELARKVLKIAKSVNVSEEKEYSKAMSIASAYRPLLLAHVFIPYPSQVELARGDN